MAQVTLRGNPVKVQGELPAVGRGAPSFTLTGADLQEKSLADYAGKKIVLSISPSLDTGVCAAAARRFNEEMSNRPNTVVLYVTADLPFAQKRFCGAEGLENVITLSTFRNPNFGELYGVRILDGPMAGLLTRAVVVLDAAGKVVHRELVPEITQEPDYAAAMAHV